MTARRPLLTAAAAGSLLCALWFVPSAKATAEHTTPTQHSHRSTTVHASDDSGDASDASKASRAKTALDSSGRATAVEPAAMGQTSDDLALADTGSFDTTPYLVGGIGFLGLGGALVTAAVRRTRASEGF
ncbi:hypothetical protein AB0I22_04320 [Streptomyces sp. NPDC050610]|uniref:hypothetical protein n=1 Tax=Streptomyces sp. NPDC050610 TaxID=3157097 RepID=UPI003448B795